jgi:hypothetical protein
MHITAPKHMSLRQVRRAIFRSCKKARKTGVWNPHEQRAGDGCLVCSGPCENLMLIPSRSSQVIGSVIENFLTKSVQCPD